MPVLGLGGVRLLLLLLLISTFPVGGVGGIGVDGYPNDDSRCERVVTRETIQVRTTTSKLVEIHVRHNVPVSRVRVFKSSFESAHGLGLVLESIN